MKKNALSLLAAMILCLLLSAGVSSAFAEEKTVSFPCGVTADIAATQLDLSAMKHSQVQETIEKLAEMTELEYVYLGSEWTEDGVTETEPETDPEALTWEDIAAIWDACGNADVEYRFMLYGYEYSTLDETFDLNHLTITDNGALVREILPCMRRCKTLDMDFCGVDDEHMAQIREDYPDIDVIWRIWFGTNCSVRTDVERILASNLDHALTDENSASLKYCTKVRLLDIGHQHITDISFMENMKDLEVCIIAINPIVDLTPISNCTNLEYLEIAATNAYDLAPLASLTKLEYLSIVQLNGSEPVEHWEALQNLKCLKKLYIGQYFKPDISAEELEELKAALPNTEINAEDETLVAGWRYNVDTDWSKTERYALLCEQFEYSNYQNVCAYGKNDPRYYASH